ncbi:DUF1549 domain-containing protein [Roseiconus nitratireducens]|uniref:DUF1549 domain-containing protein n=1 Tax=Roseiconus nitratireducens TaxID=2605748 RepID=A0A5M6DEI3_9BACT|nr:PSD1 and planctomycete cytochrome C domain-containing protein [Roseiconus nitratireducens]KAA5545944.1 DUF1549 domain-containing protein [Roseiconus nitratireducens]
MNASRIAWALALILVASLPLIRNAAANELDAKSIGDANETEFFETEIRPLLVEHCYDCHSGDEAEAGLWLDSRTGWQSGGDSGPAIVPGQPDESLVIEAVRYGEQVVSGMPPDSKLPAQKIKLLEEWIRRGAHDPREADPSSAPKKGFDLAGRVESHWSWRPIEAPPVPAVEHSDWPRNDVDRFVLARMEAVGLHPAPDADKLTWLRRVTYDLTGLPPTTQQIAAFENDTAPGARERVIDRLLDSMQFGEKWARHWMDLTRYADTYGHEFDYKIAHSHEYRDYLIRAFNADVPYDQLIREHLAGDLIEDPRRHPTEQFNESIIGTGFWYLHEATHAPTDVLQNEADIVANQIDVFGKAFLGLTIACARCHDHKFDAISTADYYALSAFLQSSCRENYPLDPSGSIAQTAEEIGRLRDRIADSLATASIWKDPETRQHVESRFESLPLKSRPVDEGASDARFASDAWTAFRAAATRIADFQGDSLPSGWTTSGEAFTCIDDSLRFAVDVQETNLVPGTVDSSALGSKAVGTLRSPTFEITAPAIHLRMRADKGLLVRMVIDNYQMAPMSSLLFNGTLMKGPDTDTQGEWKWVTMRGDIKKYLGHRAYLEFVDDGRGSIAIDQIWMTDHQPPPETEAHAAATDSFANLWQQLQSNLADGRSSSLLRWILKETIVPIESISADLPQAMKAWEKLAKNLAPPRFVIAMADGTREPAAIYIRGSHTNRGELVPPRNLQALGGQEGSRLDLADEIASKDNPLTARVFVNRVWHHLFGRGIVPTVDDFGPQGISPSHPQLLDHLAFEFVQDGWSIKRLIRRLTLSRTYLQSSQAADDLAPSLVATADPTNSLLFKMRVRRLSAESLRDSILSNSGRLDLQPYGPGVATYRTPFMTGRGARPSGPLDGDGRRTIYLSVYRNFLNPLLTTFDMPNPFGPKGRRSQSNVPAQSLALMNDPFVVDQAQFWADRKLSRSGSVKDRIAEMVLAAHTRRASEEQLQALADFVNRQTAARGGDERAAWADLAQSLWNMKAFLYLR